MVKRLFKYEISAAMRSLLAMEVIVLGIALLTRIVQFFEVDSVAYGIVRTSAIVMLCVSIIVSIIMSVILSIKRFYTNIFSAEGYLTMTLPATPTQHIIVKLVVAVLSVVGAILVSLLAGAVATMGEVFIEVCKAVGYISKVYFDSYGGHGIAYVFEVILMLLVSLSSSLLIYYACISVGQMASKKRVLFAFVAYFAYYSLTQILGTILLILVAIGPDWLKNLLYWFETFSMNHPIAVIHIVLWLVTVYFLVLSVVFFFISNYIIKNKLNLE